MGHWRVALFACLLATAGLAQDEDPAAETESPPEEEWQLGREEGFEETTGERAPAQDQKQEHPRLACYKEAIRIPGVDEVRALSLCAGADSTAPVQCYEEARRQTFLTEDKVVELCTCAVSAGPVACMERAKHETFLEETQMLRLCSPRYTREVALGCVLPYGYGYPYP